MKNHIGDYLADEQILVDLWPTGKKLADFDDFAVVKRCRELYGIDEDITEIVLKAVVHELKEANR